MHKKMLEDTEKRLTPFIADLQADSADLEHCDMVKALVDGA
jgi:hypothetical protein